MTDIKLKERCPFCGNVGEIVAIGGNPVCGKRPYYTPQCQTYNCLLDKVEAWYDTPGEAAEAWDRRALPTEIIKQETDMICSFCEKKLTECARPLFKGKGDVIMCCECFKNFATKFFLKICDKIGGI
jgi:hypothetical protein